MIHFHCGRDWFIYDLQPDQTEALRLVKTRTVYTRLSDSLNAITRPKVGKVENFLALLQSKVDEKLESPPINRTIESPY